MTNDRIERQITIAAPVERVWDILTDPQHVSAWFCDGNPVTIDLRPGGVMTIDHGPGKSFPTRIDKVDPPHYLAYRWASDHPDVLADDTNSTLVEFTLAPQGKGTLLTLSESGFAALASGPTDNGSYESHSGGWTGKLASLLEYSERL
jgi:uncharacterized protein YndB with AHSA1/START domain